MRLLVCGGRRYEQRDTVFAALDAVNRADPVGEWARDRRIALCIYIANWRGHGDAAGMIRNANMLRFGQPDRVVAFPGGKGTLDMIMRAERAGLTVTEIG